MAPAKSLPVRGHAAHERCRRRQTRERGGQPQRHNDQEERQQPKVNSHKGEEGYPDGVTDDRQTTESTMSQVNIHRPMR